MPATLLATSIALPRQIPLPMILLAVVAVWAGLFFVYLRRRKFAQTSGVAARSSSSGGEIVDAAEAALE
jgi:hypothetical protein